MWIDWELQWRRNNWWLLHSPFPLSPIFFLSHSWVRGRAKGRKAKVILHRHYCGSLFANACLPAVMAGFQLLALWEEQMCRFFRYSKGTSTLHSSLTKGHWWGSLTAVGSCLEWSPRKTYLPCCPISPDETCNYLPCKSLRVLFIISSSQLTAFGNLKLKTRTGLWSMWPPKLKGTQTV